MLQSKLRGRLRRLRRLSSMQQKRSARQQAWRSKQSNGQCRSRAKANWLQLWLLPRQQPGVFSILEMTNRNMEEAAAVRTIVMTPTVVVATTVSVWKGKDDNVHNNRYI